VVKRAHVELRERVAYLKRLAFYTITEEEAAQFDFLPSATAVPASATYRLTSAPLSG
jgi:hypothetical protein